jgi:hypothetical protein
MPATEKGLKYDFSDVSRTDSQKMKTFLKDLSHHVMNSHGPVGSLELNSIWRRNQTDDPVSDDYAALLLQFVPFGSLLIHHLDKKYCVEESTDAISMIITHDVSRNSFKDGSKAELEK